MSFSAASPLLGTSTLAGRVLTYASSTSSADESFAQAAETDGIVVRRGHGNRLLEIVSNGLRPGALVIDPAEYERRRGPATAVAQDLSPGTRHSHSRKT